MRKYSPLLWGFFCGMNDKGNEAKTTRLTPKRQSLYPIAAKYTTKALRTVVKLLDSNNEGIRVAASRILLDKSIPSLKAVEVNGGINADGSVRPIQLFINTGSGFIPTTVQLASTPTATNTASTTTIQNTDMAQESPKDNNSDIRDDKTGPS